VSSQFRFFQSINCGTITTAKGIIKVLKIPKNKMFFPGNLKRAKAYATKELEKRVAITPLTVMSVVFSAYLIMGGIPPTILEEPP
jgi:hypothetical protein